MMPARFWKLRWHDLGLDVDQMQELGGIFADSAPDDDQIRREQLLDGSVVHGESLGPLGVGEAFILLGRVGGALLRVVAVDLEVAELGVRNQHSVIDDCRPDPSSEGGDDHQAAAPLRRAVPRLGQPRRIRVVDDVYVAARGRGEEGVRVGADPGVVDVGCRADDTVTDDSGDRNANWRGGVGETA